MKMNTEEILRFITRPLEVVVLRYVFLIAIGIPIVMYLLWFFSAKPTLEIVIVNKTRTNAANMELSSLDWVLTHERIVNQSRNFYDLDSNYYGFFPRLGGDFVIHDFSNYDETQIENLVNRADILYLVDTYGVYSHDYHGDLDKPNHLLYGGLNFSDLKVLKEFRAQHKLVLSEFSLFVPPTQRTIRDSLQSILGVEWAGWAGRYFVSLDSTAHLDLPDWVINLYHNKYGPEWPFFDSGIVLVKGNDIVILEYGTHLLQEAPVIETQPALMEEYELPASVPYPFWFDIVSSPVRDNQIVSLFHLYVNDRGDSLLSAHNIPPRFPAVLKEISGQYPFYYFAGDFTDNPIIPSTAYFKGIERFHQFFYNKNIVEDRRQFFWRYYRPLLSNILQNEINRLKR